MSTATPTRRVNLPVAGSAMGRFLTSIQRILAVGPADLHDEFDGFAREVALHALRCLRPPSRR